ncbi:MAG: sigma-70 family RNA polymerase sigma factor [Ruminococcaceae bacterium]|nr:sigma-70 family RNA polymerase sigma factor [Oscillospiraceae bacterium]
MFLQDHEIVALYHARDEKAIEHSQRQYGPYCQTVAMNILNSTADADECVNDTWLAAWNSMPPQKPLSLRAYLGKLTRNLSLNRLKSLRRERRDIRLTVAFEELEDCFPAPDETESRFVCMWLNEYLETLSPTDRRLFVGRYWYGYGIKQMAKHYGLSANAVTKRISRTREGLRAFLIERGYTP